MNFGDMRRKRTVISKYFTTTFISALGGLVQERWRLALTGLALGLASKNFRECLARVEFGMLGNQVIF